MNDCIYTHFSAFCLDKDHLHTIEMGYLRSIFFLKIGPNTATAATASKMEEKLNAFVQQEIRFEKYFGPENISFI